MPKRLGNIGTDLPCSAFVIFCDWHRSTLFNFCNILRFWFLTAVTPMTVVCWNVMHFILVETLFCFGVILCFHCQDGCVACTP
jgi:hypothetical protein